MSRFKKHESAQATNAFQFTLAGLIVFSLALIGASSYVTYRLVFKNQPAPSDYFAVNPKDKTSSVRIGPWGTLMVRDIELERPVEYLTDDVRNPEPEVWTFAGMNADAVKALFTQNGLSSEQMAAAFATCCVTENGSGTVIHPSKKFLMSLDSETRCKLYNTLAGKGVNLYLDYPYIFPGDLIESIYNDTRLNPEDVALFRKLVYINGGAHQLSDYAFLLCHIPTVERRVAMAQSMSRQSAVLVRLMVNPDSDIEKIAAYWGNMPGVHFTDIQPLMESQKQLPDGGSVSLLYLLPKFARDRLYTFPQPPQPGEPTMDCHWSTFNFCNTTPDNRFNDPSYAVQFIQQNYYQIAAPSLYGDIVLLMNDKNEVKHSAVFIADDIVFTKNGNNYRQPWMLMHIPDLLATYPSSPPMRLIYMRHRSG